MSEREVDLFVERLESGRNETKKTTLTFERSIIELIDDVRPDGASRKETAAELVAFGHAVVKERQRQRNGQQKKEGSDS